MKDGKYQVLIVSSHPVQYASPLFRLMANHPKLDPTVAYLSLQGAKPGVDPEFGIEVVWDISLLEGHRWIYVPNRSPRPGLGKFWGLINPGLWGLVQSGDFDVMLVYGYAYLGFWIAILAARKAGVPLILSTDAISISPRDGHQWKVPIKRFLLPRIFELADVVLAPSSGTVKFLRSLGIPEEHIVLTPYTVDNDRFAKAAARVDRRAVRETWGIPPDVPVVLFCGKFVPWKRPQDVLRAFSRADIPHAWLVFAGEGSLRPSLEAEAKYLGVERVHFLGFVNQSALPKVYIASDVLVLPSEYEPFGLVVNEAMVCGLPVVVSDRVGAGRDLVIPEETGFIYPVRDVEALAEILRRLLTGPELRHRMGKAARKRMETWSYRENLGGFMIAVERAIRLKRGQRA